MAGETPGGVGPRSQSGWWSARSQDHQMIGSEVFCRYTARGSLQAGLRPVSSDGAVMKRTVPPPSYTGRHCGDPGSRSAVNRLHRALLFVGPTQSTPEVRSLMSSVPLNAASPPNDPRLSPKTTSLGRCAAGRCRHRAYTASNRSRPASCAGSLSAMKEIQLGRKEYWMAATAVSPPYMYSSGSIIAGLTQPVPVVVATATTFLSKAPVRSSSLPTSAASAWIDGADCRPA